jgi:hypothetical protein
MKEVTLLEAWRLVGDKSERCNYALGCYAADKADNAIQAR